MRNALCPACSRGARWLDRNDRALPTIGAPAAIALTVLLATDIGDGRQWQDEPRYPADAAHLAVELGVNFAIYALTH